MTKGNRQGAGYEGVDPAAECNINKTAKFAVWDAPGVSQPVCKPVPRSGNKENNAPVIMSGATKQKQHNNRKFTAAATTAAAATTGGGGWKLPTTTLECQCKQVIISLPGPPINRLECCCVDCKFGVEWCQKKLKGPALETTYVDLAYWPNCLQVEEGGEHMEVFKIKAGYVTSRVIATCCGTAMLGDHPYYQQQKIVAYVPPAQATVKHCEMMPAQRRIFEGDATGEIAPFQAPDKPAEAVKTDLNKWRSKHPRYTNIQRLMGSIGPLQYMDPSYEGKEPEYNRQLREASAAGH